MYRNWSDFTYAAVMEDVLNASGAGTEVEDTAIDMKGCTRGAVLVNMGAIASGSLVIKVEHCEESGGTFAAAEGDGEQTISVTGLTEIEVTATKRYWRITFTDSAHAKTWSAIAVGYDAPTAPHV